VECIIDLPHPYGQVAVAGIVRRLHLGHEDHSKGATLGVEFLNPADSPELEAVRSYIQARHTADLSTGSAELKIG